MHLITKSLLSLVVIASVLGPATATRKVRDGAQPIVFSVNPSSIHSGGTLLCTVGLDSTATDDLSITISPSDGSKFTSLPGAVTVPAGNDHVSFYATLTTSATGGFTLTASANGGYTMSPLQAISP